MGEQPLQAGRDEAVVAALGLVNRVIQLDPAADSFLWHCRTGVGRSGLATEGRRLCGAYQELGAGLADLGVTGATADAVAAIVNHHLRLLRTARSEEHTSELQSHHDLVCRLLLEKKKK